MSKKSHVGTGYTPCACRDCFEAGIGHPGEAYCHACEDAGCPDYQGIAGLNQECQVEPELYDEDEPPTTPPTGSPAGLGGG